MKDEILKFEEIETCHTLGGSGRFYTVVIHTLPSIHQSRVRGHTMSGWVVITDDPVYMGE